MKDLIKRYPTLAVCREEIEAATEALISLYEEGGTLFACGNGGSAADCEHIVGELMKGFTKKRPIPDFKRTMLKERFSAIEDDVLSKLQCGLRAVSLPSAVALNTAFANDVDADLVFAQPLFAMAKEGDLLIAISTSGNSKNIVLAVKAAKALGVRTVSLTGAKESKLSSLSDVTVRVPETETFKVQELHLPVYHYLCAEVENTFFGEEEAAL